jgi:hypothetical protein
MKHAVQALIGLAAFLLGLTVIMFVLAVLRVVSR